MNALVSINPSTNVEAYRASTDAAALCREIVIASAMEIQQRKYVKVEGWQAIAIAHGCTGSARAVERVEGGVRAIGEVRRMSDGAVIAEAEGFVGEDEPTWFGGKARKWKWGEQRGQKVWYEEDMPKRADYAIRAMAQTRAISRACRSAFAHVVVMMNAGLSTTPAEEVPQGGFDDEPVQEPRNVTPPPQRAARGAPKGAEADPFAETPNEPSGALLAAREAIGRFADVDAGLVWSQANAAGLKAMKDTDPEGYRLILMAYRQKMDSLEMAEVAA